MNKFAAALSTGIFLLLAGPAVTLAATFITPSDVVWKDVPSIAGAQQAILQGPLNVKAPFTFRVKFPTGWSELPHSHPVLIEVTVISGTFNLGIGETYDKTKTHVLPVGSVVILHPGENHFAWVNEPTVIQVQGVGPFGVKWVDPKHTGEAPQ